jgi:hypothetical protein
LAVALLISNVTLTIVAGIAALLVLQAAMVLQRRRIASPKTDFSNIVLA